MLKLRKYVGSTTALKSIGTVSEFVGAGGSFVPSSERNFRDETKRVSILLSDKDGNTDLINCAKNVSDDLRSKKLTFSTLGSFPIYEIPQVDVNGDPKMMINPETGEEEQELRYFIGYPGGASNINSIKVTVTEEMIKTPVQLSREVDWSQLVAL